MTPLSTTTYNPCCYEEMSQMKIKEMAIYYHDEQGLISLMLCITTDVAPEHPRPNRDPYKDLAVTYRHHLFPLSGTPNMPVHYVW